MRFNRVKKMARGKAAVGGWLRFSMSRPRSGPPGFEGWAWTCSTAASLFRRVRCDGDFHDERDAVVRVRDGDGEIMKCGRGATA